ncbi:MAG: hypothetical protein ACREJ2_17805 [Planctomycetota bacterium]
MKTVSLRLMAAGLTCLTWLPLHAAEGDAGAAPNATPTLSLNGADFQTAMDKMLADKEKSDAAARAALSPAGLGKQLDATLSAIDAARADDKVSAVYAGSWNLLRLLPQIAYKTQDAREQIAQVSAQNRAFLAAHEAVLNRMTDDYLHFKQQLGLRSPVVDQAAQKLGLTGEIDASKGNVAAEGDIPVAAAAGAKPTVTDAQKARIASLESAFKKLLAVDGKKVPDDYTERVTAVADNLDDAWYFQVLYKADAKIGADDPETLHFLESLNHGLGDLSRYAPVAQAVGWNLNQLDTAAGVDPTTGAPLGPGSGDLTAGSATANTTPGAAGGASTPIAQVPATGTTGGAGGDASAGGGANTAAGGAATSGNTAGGADDWQAKLDAQLTKPATPTATPAATSDGKVELDDASQKLATSMGDNQQTALSAQQNKDVDAFFKSEWALLRLAPEAAYKTADMRQAMAGVSDDAKAFLTANKQTLDALSRLYQRFKQHLGLRSAQVNRIARRMGVKGNIDETKGAAAQQNNGDISLGAGDSTGVTSGGGDAAGSITAAERYRIALLENNLKRLEYFQKTKDLASAKTEFQSALNNLDGAYFFQVLYKQNEQIGTTYPLTLKFLQTLDGGLGDLRAYQDLLQKYGLTVDDNGDLAREGPDGQTTPISPDSANGGLDGGTGGGTTGAPAAGGGGGGGGGWRGHGGRHG